MSNEVAVRLPAATPSELNFPEPSRAVNGSNLLIKVPSNLATVNTKQGRTFKITIPNSANYWNPRSSKLTFNCKLLVSVNAGFDIPDGARHIALNKHINSLFDRIVIRNGTTEIQEIQQYNLLSNILYETGSTEEYNQTVGEIMANGGDYRERRENCFTVTSPPTVVTRRYCMQMVGFDLLESHTLPLFVSAPWTIEFRMAPLDTFLEFTGTQDDYNAYAIDVAASGFQVLDCELDTITFNTHVLSADSRLESQLVAEFANTSKKFTYTGYDYYSSQASGNNASIIIPTRKSMISGILCVQRDFSDSKDFRYKDKLNGKWLHNGVKQYYATVNSVNIPSDPIDCTNGGAEGFCELLRYLNKSRITISSLSINDDSWQVDDNLLTTTQRYAVSQKFIMALNLKGYNTSLVSGMNTASNTGSLVLKIQQEDVSGLHPDNNYEIFTRFTGIVLITAGRVSVVQ